MDMRKSFLGLSGAVRSAIPLDGGASNKGDLGPSGSGESGYFDSALSEIQILSITPFS